MIMESGMFNISKYNRNVPIVVKMRGQPTSDDLTLMIYGIFLNMGILANFS